MADNEAVLRDQLDRLCEDMHILQLERQDLIIREQQMTRQTQELVLVVDEQTRQLKDRDHEIQSLLNSESQQWERKFHELQQTMIINGNNSSGQISQSTLILNPQLNNNDLMLEKMDLLAQIEDLKDKLAVEFNKKRKMKVDYEDKCANLTEELHYYKEVKCGEMRDLLNHCKVQLREFEELNGKRNEVIERLEKENAMLK